MLLEIIQVMKVGLNNTVTKKKGQNMIKYLELCNKIKVKLSIPEGKTRTEVYIICHGFGSAKDGRSTEIMAHKLNENGFIAISFDFPGHGDSIEPIEKLTVENCISYINEVFEYVKNEFKNHEISILSTSFGAYVTINKLIKDKKNEFKNIVLRCPAIDMKNILINVLIKGNAERFKQEGKIKAGFEGQKELTYSFYEDLCEHDILKTYNKKERILILQGLEDDIAPIQDTYEFVKMDSENIRLIPLEGVKHKMTNEELEMLMSVIFKELDYII